MTTPKRMIVCPECSLRFAAPHHRTMFCTPEHKKAYNNRLLAEGQRIVALAKAWRSARGVKDASLKAAGKAAFSTLCRELDALNQADTAAGRQPALKVFRARSRAGLLDFQGAVNRVHRRPAAE